MKQFDSENVKPGAEYLYEAGEGISFHFVWSHFLQVWLRITFRKSHSDFSRFFLSWVAYRMRHVLVGFHLVWDFFENLTLGLRL